VWVRLACLAWLPLAVGASGETSVASQVEGVHVDSADAIGMPRIASQAQAPSRRLVP
jgi:hypothetical protein